MRVRTHKHAAQIICVYILVCINYAPNFIKNAFYNFLKFFPAIILKLCSHILATVQYTIYHIAGKFGEFTREHLVKKSLANE